MIPALAIAQVPMISICNHQHQARAPNYAQFFLPLIQRRKNRKSERVALKIGFRFRAEFENRQKWVLRTENRHWQCISALLPFLPRQTNLDGVKRPTWSTAMNTDLLERPPVTSKPTPAAEGLFELLSANGLIGEVLDCLLPRRAEGTGTDLIILANAILGTQDAVYTTPTAPLDWVPISRATVANAARNVSEQDDPPEGFAGGTIVATAHRIGLRFMSRLGDDPQIGVLLPAKAGDLGALTSGRVFRLV